MDTKCAVCGSGVVIEKWYLDLFSPVDPEEVICESCLQAERAQYFCRTSPVLPPLSWLVQE